jgi:hypothetical protein
MRHSLTEVKNMKLSSSTAHFENASWIPNDTGGGPPGAVSGSMLINNASLGSTPTGYSISLGFEGTDQWTPPQVISRDSAVSLNQIWKDNAGNEHLNFSLADPFSTPSTPGQGGPKLVVAGSIQHDGKTDYLQDPGQDFPVQMD